MGAKQEYMNRFNVAVAGTPFDLAWRYFFYFFKKLFISGLLIIITVFVLQQILSGVSCAQEGYPPYIDLYVNDYAGLLTEEEADDITILLSNLKRDRDIESTVLTIDSIHDYGTSDRTIESFATNLFNTWGIGDPKRNNGMLILVAVKDRQVRIELGAGYEKSWDAVMQQIIDEQMLPSFRKNDYGPGIYKGVLALSQVLTEGSPPNSKTVFRVTIGEGALKAAFSAGATVAVGGIVFGLWRYNRYRRYRKRNCPNCGTPMTLLDEVTDDVYLDSGQKVEELLKSVNYDVWKCPICNTHTLHGYSSWFFGLKYKKCINCGYRTLETISQTIVEATYMSEGKERITKKCRNCHYLNEEVITLPRLVKDERDSSSSSRFSFGGSRSFGGGRSSGGGASGKW